MAGGDGDVTILDPNEEAIFDAYKEAIKSGLDSADSAADKLLTAAFSIAAAYGALVGLVTPKEQASPLLVGLPFALLGGAAVFAMASLVQAVRPAERPTGSQTIEAFKRVLRRKRICSSIAVGVSVLALLVAGYVIVNTYRPVADDSVEPALATITVIQHRDGTDAISSVCPDALTNSVEGLLDLKSVTTEFVVVEVPEGGCVVGRRVTLRLPREEVLAIESSAAAKPVSPEPGTPTETTHPS